MRTLDQAALQRRRRMVPREGSDDYPFVLVTVGNRRVIDCKDHIQWIIQHRLRNGKNAWEGRSYCRSKEALIRLFGCHFPELDELPEMHP